MRKLFAIVIIVTLSLGAKSQSKVVFDRKLIDSIPKEAANLDSLKMHSLNNDTLIKYVKFEKKTKRQVRRYNWFYANKISLYGGGSIFSLLTSSDSLNSAASPSGSIGLNFQTRRITGNLFFSYNGKETIPVYSLEQFGTVLMNPNTGGHSLNLTIFGRISKYRNYLGFNFKCLIVNNIWQIDSSTTVDSSPILLSLGGYICPFDFSSLKENNINLLFEGNFTHREILGDFYDNADNIEGNKITPRGFNGFDFSLHIFVNMLELYTTFSVNDVLDKENKTHIPGFSGSQITFGINVTGDLLNLK
jgi:hypothetical protein